MPLLQLIILLIVIGLICWLVQRYLPIPEPIKTVIVVLLVIACIIALLDWSGLLNLHAHAMGYRPPAPR